MNAAEVAREVSLAILTIRFPACPPDLISSPTSKLEVNDVPDPVTVVPELPTVPEREVFAVPLCTYPLDVDTKLFTTTNE